MNEAPRNVAVIDDDELIRNLVTNYFKKLGAEVVDQYADGQEAWLALQEKQYDFVVLDWKLPRLSGLALFNRLRKLSTYKSVPILVVSGFLEKSDFRLLDEFPFTYLIEKPFPHVKFLEEVEKLQEEMAWSYKNAGIVSSLSELMHDDPKKAVSTINKLIAKAPNPLPIGITAARRFESLGMIAEAEATLNKLLEFDENSIVVMNELAKVYLRKKRYKNASEMLRRAHKRSPVNMNRICLLGEIELNLRDPYAAQEYFRSALEIDDENSIAKSGVVVSENMIEMIRSPEPVEMGQSFASILNSIGIGMVKKGNFAEGIEQYQSALAFLHSNIDSARLAFNMGLGYLRWGKPSSALPWFEKSEEIGGSDFTRSNGFVRKLKSAKTVDSIAAEEAATAIDEGPSFGPAEPTAEHNEIVGGMDPEEHVGDSIAMAPLGAEGSSFTDDEDGAPGEEDVSEDEFAASDSDEPTCVTSITPCLPEDDGDWADFDVNEEGKLAS